MKYDEYQVEAEASWCENWHKGEDAAEMIRHLWVENKSMQSRLESLEKRLEMDGSHPIDGISARDATIKAQDDRIEAMEKDAARYRQIIDIADKSLALFLGRTGYRDDRRYGDIDIAIQPAKDAE